MVESVTSTVPVASAPSWCSFLLHLLGNVHSNTAGNQHHCAALNSNGRSFKGICCTNTAEPTGFQEAQNQVSNPHSQKHRPACPSIASGGHCGRLLLQMLRLVPLTSQDRTLTAAASVPSSAVPKDRRLSTAEGNRAL